MSKVTSERVAKIKSAGWWKVTIRPTAFNERAITTLSKLWDLVETCKVSLRGWDYPHIEEREKSTGQDWIQSGIDWPSYGHVEVWRFYQSAQFVHDFACLEDYNTLPWESSDGKPEKYLLLISTLYTATEIYEFATRLAAREALLPSVYVSITLGNMAGRELTGWDLEEKWLLPGRGYRSNLDEIKIDNTHSTEALMSRSSTFALDASQAIFERFGWMHSPRDWLEDQQERLISRRRR